MAVQGLHYKGMFTWAYRNMNIVINGFQSARNFVRFRLRVNFIHHNGGLGNVGSSISLVLTGKSGKTDWTFSLPMTLLVTHFAKRLGDLCQELLTITRSFAFAFSSGLGEVLAASFDGPKPTCFPFLQEFVPGFQVRDHRLMHFRNFLKKIFKLFFCRRTPQHGRQGHQRPT